MSDIIHTRVFDRNIEAYRYKSPLIVNQGGTRSSKSFSILQLLYYIAKGKKTPLIISVVSRTLPHLKLGVMRDFDMILEAHGVNVDKVKNKTDSYYKIGQSIIEFWGVDNIAKVHGPQRDILFVNEANYIKKDIFDQLSVRTKGTIFVDYNPSRRFWYHDDIIGKVDHTFIQSTYKDNNCLSAEQIKRIEAKMTNEAWWRVYGLGELGRLEGAILTNWANGDFPNDRPFIFGLDFGVTDPDAMVRVAVDQKAKKIWVKEEIYQNNLTTSQLLQIVDSRGVKDKLIVVDSAAARTRLDMSHAGMNAISAHKIPIVDGIRLLQDYEIIIDPLSGNLMQELDTWTWIDKRGGVPLDGNNHLIDAMRYAVLHLVKPLSQRKMRVG